MGPHHAATWAALILGALYVSAQPFEAVSGPPGGPPGGAVASLGPTATQQPAGTAGVPAGAADVPVKLEPAPGAPPGAGIVLAPGASDSSWAASKDVDVPGQPGGGAQAGTAGPSKGPESQLPTAQDTPQNNGVIIGAAVGAALAAGLIVGAVVLAIHLRRKKRAGSCADTESPFAQQSGSSSKSPGLINKIVGVGIGSRHTAARPTHGSTTATAAAATSRQQPAAAPSSLPAGKASGLSGLQANGRSAPAKSKTTVLGPNLSDQRNLDSFTDSYDSTTDGGGTGFGGTAAAVTAAAAAAAAAGVGAGAAAAAAAGGAAAAAVSRCSSRGDLAVGFTEDELQGRLRQLKYVITEKLLAVVASSTLENDPIRAWLDAGVDQVRSPEAAGAGVAPAAAGRGSSSASDYTTNRAFVDDFRVHKVLDWLQHRHWRYIRSDRRLLHVQAPPDISQTDFARHMLGQINHNTSFRPFVKAVDKSVSKLVSNAVTVATAIGAMSAAEAAASQPAATLQYESVLWDVCAAALKLHLQVQGTTDTAFVFTPGAADCAHEMVPIGGLVCKERPGGTVAVCMCERPGVFSRDEVAGVTDVWAPAEAVRIVPV